MQYRTLFLQFVLSQIDACDKASEVAKSVSILHAIRWVAQAWDAVTPETIRKCFRKAGILDDSFSVVARPYYEHDPFLDLDSTALEIESLMQQIQPEEGTCSSTEFVNGDDNIATCFETDDDSWDQQFIASLDSQFRSTGVSSDPEEEDEEEELAPPQTKVRNLSEAIYHLEDVRAFLDNKGHLTEATMPYFTARIDKVVLMTFFSLELHVHHY